MKKAAGILWIQIFATMQLDAVGKLLLDGAGVKARQIAGHLTIIRQDVKQLQAVLGMFGTIIVIKQAAGTIQMNHHAHLAAVLGNQTAIVWKLRLAGIIIIKMIV